MNALHVFSILGTAEAFFDGQFRYLSENNIAIHLICSSDSRSVQFCDQNNIANFDAVEISRRISPIKDLKAIVRICKYIHNNNIDVVVGHTPKGALVAMVAAFLMNVKHRIYYRHGLIYTTKRGLARFILKSEEQFVSFLATKIICVSPSLCTLSIKDKLNRQGKQVLIGKGTCGGIDTINKFNPELIQTSKLSQYRLKYSMDRTNLILGFCGRLCKDKGIVELIEGFHLFSSAHPECNAKMLLIGSYDGRDMLPQSVKDEIQNNSNIINTGRINIDMEYYYALLDVFIFPSYREGFGMSVIEASAMQKPILVSKSHGCVDSIIDSVTGHYVGINAESIAAGVESLLDSVARVKMGENGRQFVVQNFERTHLWPQILELYQSLK